MTSRKEKSEKLTKKIKSTTYKIIKILIVLSILLGALFYYMRFIEPKMLITKEIKITSSSIPTSFDGFKIVHLSDIHYKMTTDVKDLERIVKEVNKLKPDILVITGDLLDDTLSYSKEELTSLEEQLSNINVKMNKYYIKGNHDYSEDADSIYKNSNFKSLNNNNDLLYIKDSYISITGYGSSIKNDFNFQDKEAATYKIALIHEGDNLNKIINENYDLVLAGHSHNIQVNIPFIKKLFTVTGCKKYYENHYKVNNTDLYISSGIGTSNYKIRLFNPPTINFYRLMTN